MPSKRRTTEAETDTSRLLGYCRVSTLEQAREGVSMEAQRERLEAYCTAHGCELFDVETDNGSSGSIAPHKRPGLARALLRIRRGEADGLLALKLDRISRSTRDVLDLVDECRRRGWRLVSVSEQLDTGTAAGRLVLTVLAALAEMEREQVAERTRVALAHVARQGRARSRFTPYGSCTEDGATEIPKGYAGKLKRHPGETRILGRMLALRDEGVGATETARRLVAAGHATRSAKPWTQRSVWAVLAAYDKREKAGGAQTHAPHALP